MSLAGIVVCTCVLLFYAAFGSAEVSSGPPHVILATVGIGKDRWQLVAFEGAKPVPRRACFGVGYKLVPSPGFVFAGSLVCQLPKFDGPTDGTGGQERTVLGIAFQPNVVRVHLDLGEVGERDVALKLLTRKEARQIHVDRFRWGYVKLIGHICMRSAIGYNADGRIVYQAKEDPATPCELG